MNVTPFEQTMQGGGDRAIAAAVRHSPSGTGAGRYAAARLGAASRNGMGEAAFEILGIVGKKTFVDDDLPAGVGSVEYTIQGQRADRRGAVSPILTVNFGTRTGLGTKIAPPIHAAVGASMKANTLVTTSRAGV